MASKNTDQPASGGEAAPKAQVVTPEQKKTLEQRAEAGEKLTVGELAAVTGNIRCVNLPRITTVNTETGATETDHAQTAFTPEHLAAATLHGWKAHAHHSGKPMTLSLRDYKAALVAASKAPAGYITPCPHAAAFSEYAKPINLVTTALKKERFPKEDRK